MSTANEWDVELNTRRETSDLQATLYYFVYHMNTVALYWEEKPNSLMNENKLIDNPRITTWPYGAKGEWRVSIWLAISTHVKKISYSFPQGWKSLYNTAVYVINVFIMSCTISLKLNDWFHYSPLFTQFKKLTYKIIQPISVFSE